MRRVLLVGVILLALVVGVPVVGFLTARNATPNLCGTTGEPLRGGDPVPVSNPGARFEVRIASWNTLATNSTDRIVSGLRAIGDQVDVIGVQELNPEGRRRAVETRMGRSWGVSSGNNSVPILWNKARYQLLAEGSEKVFDIERIEDGVAGVSIGPKSIPWVQLRDKGTGAVFFVANYHIVPSIDRSGRPNTQNPKRLALYQRQMIATVAVVNQLRRYGPVFVTGDFNVDARRDALAADPSFPYSQLRAAGLASNWSILGYPKAGTQSGGRLIDYVWANTATATLTRQTIAPSYGSDHKAVIVTARNAANDSAVSAQLGSAAAVRATASSADQPPIQLTVPGPAAGSTMVLSGEQITIASAIIAEGKAHGISPQGWIVGLVTVLQESGIRNLDYGDRDSRGPFQQRPVSGWGTVAQITDIKLSIQAFYGVATHTANPGLVDISGWEEMPVTRAAQAVQRSAFPDAYAKWEATARAIVQRLGGLAGSGDADGGCGDPVGVDGHCPATGLPAEGGLTPDALLVIRCGHEKFPTITSIGGVRADALPDHPSGRAIDLMIPDYQTAEGKAFGWQVARWMRANHQTLGVQYVIFDAKIWNIARDDEGWRRYRSVTASIDDSSMHYNHVHVTVFGTKGTGPVGSVGNTPGRWTMPLPAGSYTVGCSMTCYAGHTGQDFPAAVGTEVRSSNDGIVVRSEALRNRAGGYVSYGNLIVIQVAGKPNMTVWYAHLSARHVKVGDRITAGQLIGASGNTGHSEGPHLHYEIRVGGTPTDPMTILRQKGVTP